MNKLEYQLLTMLSRDDQTTEDIYTQVDSLSEAHVLRTLNALAAQGWCGVVGTFKRDPGTPGRPMSVYGITDKGMDRVKQEDDHMDKLRGKV